MKRTKKKREEGEYNFWQPATDMMTGLVFILMLIIMLLGLYLLDSYGDTEELNSNVSSEAANDYDGYDDTDDGSWIHNEATGNDNGNGSGDGQYNEIPQTGGGGGYGDDGIKSAVFVELVDDETDRVIPEAGIDFELYRTDTTHLQDGSRETLYTYYPEKISYREFETTEDGTFYLPEKVWQGDYYFHELTAPEGYDLAADTYFDIDEMYDWPDPYVVQIRVSPCKNIIRIQMNDAETELPVGGGTFRVIAAEDVTTMDGTVRYTKGQIVGTITCDENGYGESDELYLGKYTVQQVTVPEYYTSMLEDLDVEVEKKSDKETEIHQINTEKTKIVLTLSDALYTDQKIEGAIFTVTNETTKATQTVATDTTGSVTISDLNKNTTYSIRQQQTVGDYRLDDSEYTVKVSSNGRIDGESTAELALTNRMLRVSVRAVDSVLRSDTENVELSLYTSAGQLIKTWTSNGASESFTDLAEGSYYIQRGNDASKKYEFTVEDTEAVQNWTIQVFTAKSAIAIVLIALVVGFVLWFAIFLLRLLARKRKEKKQAVVASSSGENDDT